MEKVTLKPKQLKENLVKKRLFDTDLKFEISQCRRKFSVFSNFINTLEENESKRSNHLCYFRAMKKKKKPHLFFKLFLFLYKSGNSLLKISTLLLECLQFHHLLLQPKDKKCALIYGYLTMSCLPFLL